MPAFAALNAPRARLVNGASSDRIWLLPEQRERASGIHSMRVNLAMCAYEFEREAGPIS
jgi:hypothetical protein